MFTTTIEWHNAAEELPTESGQYLVYTGVSICDLPYSSRHKCFNTLDKYDDADTAIEAIYWAKLPEFPKTESEDE